MHTAIGWLREQFTNNDLIERMEKDLGYKGRDGNTDILYRMLEADAPHYVISKEIIDLLAKDEVQRSMCAMVKAGIKHLPFDPILIEYRDDHDGSEVINFVRIGSKPLSTVISGYRIDGGEVNETTVYDLYAYVMVTTKKYAHLGSTPIISTHDADPVRFNWLTLGRLADRNVPFNAYYDTRVRGKDGKIVEDVSKMTLASTAIYGMCSAFLMLNTRGIQKEHVSTEKLDRIRTKAGKPRIGSYSVLKIGTVYDRDGKGHSRETTGRHMPVHWRAGHVREQRWGPGWTKVRTIFIQPTLVNFKEDGVEPPLPRHEVVL